MTLSSGFPGLVTTRTGAGRVGDRSRIDRPLGCSRSPYDSFNMGVGLGDELDAVQANRSAVAAHVGLARENLVFMSQVHGTRIAEISGPRSTAVLETDGMVSATAGIGLAVLVADCVPVLASHRAAGVIGVAHAGRKGAAGGILPALIDAMVLLGADPGGLEVLVGPAICGLCYEVPDQMRDAVEAQLPGSACVTSAGTPGLDLRAGLLRQLEDLGVGAVELDLRCTREDPDLFSHRRSAPTGRFAGVIRL